MYKYFRAQDIFPRTLFICGEYFLDRTAIAKGCIVCPTRWSHTLSWAQIHPHQDIVSMRSVHLAPSYMIQIYFLFERDSYGRPSGEVLNTHK